MALHLIETKVLHSETKDRMVLLRIETKDLLNSEIKVPMVLLLIEIKVLHLETKDHMDLHLIVIKVLNLEKLGLLMERRDLPHSGIKAHHILVSMDLHMVIRDLHYLKIKDLDLEKVDLHHIGMDQEDHNQEMVDLHLERVGHQ